MWLYIHIKEKIIPTSSVWKYQIKCLTWGATQIFIRKQVTFLSSFFLNLPLLFSFLFDFEERTKESRKNREDIQILLKILGYSLLFFLLSRRCNSALPFEQRKLYVKTKVMKNNIIMINIIMINRLMQMSQVIWAHGHHLGVRKSEQWSRLVHQWTE